MCTNISMIHLIHFTHLVNSTWFCELFDKKQTLSMAHQAQKFKNMIQGLYTKHFLCDFKILSNLYHKGKEEKEGKKGKRPIFLFSWWYFLYFIAILWIIFGILVTFKIPIKPWVCLAHILLVVSDQRVAHLVTATEGLSQSSVFLPNIQISMFQSFD